MSSCVSRSLIALVLLGFASSAPGLTQSEVSAAMVEAFKEYAAYSTGNDFTFYSVPLTDEENAQYLASLLTYSSSPDDLGSSITKVLYDYIVVRWWPYIRQIGSYSNVLDNIRSDISSLSQTVSGYTQSASWSLSVLESIGHDLYFNSSSIIAELGSALDLLSSLDANLRDQSMLSATNMVEVLSALDSAIEKLDSVDANLDLTYNAVYDIQYLIDDAENYLYEIEQHTEDTAGATGGIFDWLQYQFYDILVQAQASLIADLPTEYDVNVLNWPSSLDINLPSGWDSGLLHSLAPLKDIAHVSTNTAGLRADFGDFVSWFTNGFAVETTNFYASLTPSVGQSHYIESQTNLLSTVVVSNDVDSTAEVEDLQEEAQEYTSSWFDDLDFFTDNPYDGADSALENFEDSVVDLVGDVNPATTSDVILFGSVDSVPSRASSDIQAQVARLPRIEFNMEYLFMKWRRLATIQNLFKSLWLIVGVFYRLILLWKFLEWFAKYDKG